MKKVRIYLRSLSIPEDSGNDRKLSPIDVSHKLLLFDSNRNGAVNDLVTVVPSGALVIWKKDRRSGISKISAISTKIEKGNEFKIKPLKRFLCGGYKWRAPVVKETTEIPYDIEYLPCCTKEPVKIDPFIRISPPPP